MVHQRSGDAVGEALGRHPAFITPGHARELALAPGTTLSRLLVDPADGRLIERLPPGCGGAAPGDRRRRLLPGTGKPHPRDVMRARPRDPLGHRRSDQRDQPDPEGRPQPPVQDRPVVDQHPEPPTRPHLADTPGPGRTHPRPRLPPIPPHPPHPGRRIPPPDRRQPRPHQHRRSPRPDTNPPPPPDDNRTPTRTGAPTRTGGSIPTFEDDLDLARRALYTALAHRGTAALLADTDDADGATDHDPRLTGWITLTHRGQDGQRRGGPPEDLDTLPSLLGFSPTPEHATETDEKGPRQPRDGQPDAPPPF